MAHPTSAARAWNTWDARFPGCMVHVPSRFAIRLCAYSTRGRAFTEFDYRPEIRLGPHASDGSFVELELAHEGSRLRLRFAKPDPVDPGTIVGEIEVLQTAEWALRYWYVLEAGFVADAIATVGSDADEVVRLEVPPGPAAYVEPPVATARSATADATIALALSERPAGAHLYEDPAEVRREFEEGGYYERPPHRPTGRWVAFRFPAVTRRAAFAACVRSDADAAGGAAGARAALAHADAALADQRAATAPDGSALSRWRAAVRDVVAWNTVWDPLNRRPYTVATRTWAAERFGGWFVWLQDAFYHALLAASVGDAETARANIDAALANATPAGNLAALRAGTTDWVDRSHLPIGGHCAWRAFELTGDRSILERSYPVLARAFRWWFEARDGDGNGLLEPGSSPVGDGHFVHTKQAAMDEAAMDNSPIYDQSVFDPATHTLDCEDVALNAQLVLEAESLARIAGELERPPEEATAYEERAVALGALVRERLWDQHRRVFANRLWDGRFVRSLSPTSFYPMAAGIATREQAAALVREHLMDAGRFWGDFPVAGTPHDDPAAADDVYWRGRVWPTMNYLVWLGLRRYGFDAEAAELAERGAAMFDRGWAERRSFENFNQRTGEGGDSVDCDPFYTWGALLPLIALMAAEPAPPRGDG